MSGILYVVSTPIGNLGDITLRALEALKGVDLIACEDTRTTGKLLARYAISKPLVSYHEHNEREKAEELLSILIEGKSIALVTDAGTPGVSDPGYRLVKLASGHGVKVIPLPGPSAALSALSVSGLPTSGFAFFGFPPRAKKALADFLRGISGYTQTLIFYESPRRIRNTLVVMLDILGDRNIALCREMTKIYEEVLRGKLSFVIEYLEKRGELKGEITLIVEGASTERKKPDAGDIDGRLKACMGEGMSLKESVRLVSDETGYSKSKTYKRAHYVWGKE